MTQAEISELARLLRSISAHLPLKPLPEHIEEGPPVVRSALGWIFATFASDAHAGVTASALNAVPALIAEIERLRETLKAYQDDYCEGYCSEIPGMHEDCGGCRARAALGEKPNLGHIDARPLISGD